jgi:hypothetical protein
MKKIVISALILAYSLAGISTFAKDKNSSTEKAKKSNHIKELDKTPKGITIRSTNNKNVQFYMIPLSAGLKISF